MAAIGGGAKGLLYDGRPVRLVAGTVGYAGVPRELWADRLRAARRLGLNAVTVPAVWAVHEPVKGKLSFEGQADIASFVRLAGEHGLWTIVRMGPVIGDGWSLGGMPAWMAVECDGQGPMRSPTPVFMTHVSAWLSALARELAPLQADRARAQEGGPGAAPAAHPLLAIQLEHEWFCGATFGPKESYLPELARYVREGGISVPLVNTNNLFAVSMDEEIETWSGYGQLHAVTRQLGAVAPDSPRIIGQMLSDQPPAFGERDAEAKSGEAVGRAIAEALAAGAHVNLSSAGRGWLPGFAGGLLSHSEQSFAPPHRGPGELIADPGSMGVRSSEPRRILTFASNFGRVFNGQDPEDQPVTPSPSGNVARVVDERTGVRDASGSNESGVVAVHRPGGQGSVVFLFSDDLSGRRAHSRTLELADGSHLTVDMGKRAVCWVLLGAHLAGPDRIDHCTLCALGHAGNVFVCFGQAGVTGTVSISGSVLQVEAPKGKSPVIERVGDSTVVVINEAMTDACVFTKDAVYIGAADVKGSGESLEVIKANGFGSVIRVDASGDETIDAQTPPRAGKGPTLGGWETAPSDEQVAGESVRYAYIDGPSSMGSLGVGEGYGWYRATFKSASAKRVKTALFESADRLHLFLDGEHTGDTGLGPGMDREPMSLPLKRKTHTLTILADNMGHASDGAFMGEPRGVWGHLWEVTPVKAGAAKVVDGERLEPLELRAPIMGLHQGDLTAPRRLSWTFQHRRKTPIFVVADRVSWTGVLVVNGEAKRVLAPGVRLLVKLDEEDLKRGSNTIEIALAAPMEQAEAEYAEVKKEVSFWEGKSCLTEKAEWAFARWEPPRDDLFEAVGNQGMTGAAGKKLRGAPRWWRCRFTGARADAPLMLDLTGLSKGVVMLNGRPVGRYFVQTASGDPVPPQDTLWLPAPWMDLEGENELVIFDEHGFAPDKVKLTHERAY